MLKKTIAFIDFDGNKQTEDHYFNLNKAELFEMEVTAEGNSLQEHLRKIAESENGKMIMDAFKGLLEKAYGVRSDDGKRFLKSSEIFKQFTETEAYSEFFFEIVTDAEKMSAFVNGLMPADLSKDKTVEDIQARALAQKGGYNKPVEKDLTSVPELPTDKVEQEHFPKQLTRDELEAQLRAMGPSEN